MFIVIDPKIVIDIINGAHNKTPAGTFVWMGSYSFRLELLANISNSLRGNFIAEPRRYPIAEPFQDYLASRTLVCKLVLTVIKQWSVCVCVCARARVSACAYVCVRACVCVRA